MNSKRSIWVAMSFIGIGALYLIYEGQYTAAVGLFGIIAATLDKLTG